MCPHDKLRLLSHFLLGAHFINIQKLWVLALKIWFARLEDLIFSFGKVNREAGIDRCVLRAFFSAVNSTEYFPWRRLSSQVSVDAVTFWG